MWEIDTREENQGRESITSNMVMSMMAIGRKIRDMAKENSSIKTGLNSKVIGLQERPMVKE